MLKEEIHSLCERKTRATLFFFIIILHGTAVSQAKFLDQKEAKRRPRTRIGSYASSTGGMIFLEPNRLGSHGYKRNWSEKNGIVYTRKAGHIDIAHLRKTIDWTAYLAAKTFNQLMNSKTEFSYKPHEPSLYLVQLTYPQYWHELSQEQKARTAYEISVRLGQYFAYTASVWHEIITWFGYKCTGFYPEFQSAFSWEDIFSNLLGSHIAVLAMRDTKHTFEEAVTLALDWELKALEVQPKHAAIRAAEAVRGKWFSGDLFFVSMKKRNLDIGLDDGFVTPWIVPSFPRHDRTEAPLYPVPNLNYVLDCGFSVKLEIEPKEWEKHKILKVVYPDVKERKKRLEPAIHFAPIMEHIMQDAVRKYGRAVDSPRKQ